MSKKDQPKSDLPKSDEKKPPELKFGESKYQTRQKNWAQNLRDGTQEVIDFVVPSVDDVKDLYKLAKSGGMAAVSMVAKANVVTICASVAALVTASLVNTFADEIVGVITDGTASLLIHPCSCFEEHYTRCYEDEVYRGEQSDCCYECTGDKRMTPDQLEPKVPDNFTECKSGCKQFSEAYCSRINPDTLRPYKEDYRRCCEYCDLGRTDSEFRKREMDKWVDPTDLKPSPNVTCYENCLKDFDVQVFGYCYCTFVCYLGYGARIDDNHAEGNRTNVTFPMVYLMMVTYSIQITATSSLSIFLFVTGCIYRKRPKPKWFIIAVVTFMYFLTFTLILTSVVWLLVKPKMQEKLAEGALQIVLVIVPLFLLIRQEVRPQKQNPQTP